MIGRNKNFRINIRNLAQKKSRQMIDKSTIDKIYETAEITEVISDFVTLKRRGVNYIGLCPFHHEKTPSFTVSPSKGIYKCFGCGKAGNAVNFIMEHESLSYTEALRYMARKYQIDIVEKDFTPEDIAQKNERESLLVVTAFAANYFNQTLLKTDEGKVVGLSYFRERGVRDDMIQKFHLGYSPEQRDALTQKAIKEGYKTEYLIKTGLTIDKDGHLMDRFAGRVIFPIHSISGQVIAFGARTLKTDKTVAKYLNSPESDIYHKSKVLYGIFQAKKAIVQNDKCYLVEGYTDVIGMHQAGIENVVASSGTSLTTEQIRLIKRFTNNLTIVYDGDQAGIKAALRGIDMSLEEGMNVRVILLPDGEDPDSFCRKHHSQEVLSYFTRNETDFVLFKTRLLAEDAQNDPIKKANLISEIVRSIAIIPEPIVRSVYIKECAPILQTNEQLLYSEIIKFRRKLFESNPKLQVNQPNTVDPIKPIASETNLFEVHEREIIRLLLKYGNHILFEGYSEAKEKWIVTVAQYIISEIAKDELTFHHPIYKIIFDEYARYYFDDTEMATEYFIRHPNIEVVSVVADLISQKYVLSKKLFERTSNTYVETEEMKLSELVPSVILDFKNKKLLSIINTMKLELLQAQNENNEDKVQQLQIHIQHLNEVKKTFANHLGKRTILP